MKVVLRNYFAGIGAIALGAGASDALDSMLPLALAGAFGLMCTASLVRAIWKAPTKRNRGGGGT